MSSNSNRGSMKEILKSMSRGYLYRNSVFMIVASVTSAGVSFLFWLLAARHYPISEVGVASAMISVLTLLVTLSRIGLEQSLIRYLPSRDFSKVYVSCASVTTLAVFILGIVFLVGLPLLSPELSILRSNWTAFLAFLVVASNVNLAGILFLAMRRGELYLIQSFVLDSRLLLLLPLVAWGAMGIFSSVGLSYLLAIVFCVYAIARLGMRLTSIDIEFLRESFRFSLGNYFVGLLIAAPVYVLPLIVLAQLGEAETARYYVAYAVASLLFIIPTGISTSLYIEGSHDEAVGRWLNASARAIFVLLLPAIAVLFVLGEDLLRFFGEGYAEAFSLLRLVALSSISFSVISVYLSVKKIQKDVLPMLFVALFVFLSQITLSILLIDRYGLVGIGYAWIGSYSAAAFVIAITVMIKGNS